MSTLIELPEALPRHPARYTDALMPTFVDMLQGSNRILDPFGGTGRIFSIGPMLHGATIDAVEIEPEWAAYNQRTTVGSALALPWPGDTFDAICTSPAYGNRMADCHTAKDSSRRNTYTHAIGRKLHADNSGAMQWGPKYQNFHTAAWTEARRVLQAGGRFVLNIKDHYRSARLQHVTAWHCEALQALGFVLIEHRRVDCPGQRYGANSGLRMDYESVILFRLEAKA